MGGVSSWCSAVVLAFLGFAAGAEGEPLAYYSDYFSFVGEDSAGRAAFALDNNRGRDGDSFQAEHFAVLHIEGAGWQPLIGGGSYPNEQQALRAIPDSSAFAFQGSAEDGFVVESRENGLRLETRSLTGRLQRAVGASGFRMASAPADLTWRGRRFKGRVIHEWLHLEGSNRLARFEFGLLKGFQAYYLRVGNGDLYVHQVRSSKLSGLIGELEGFYVEGGEGRELKGARLDVRAHRWAIGLYRWPETFSLTWSAKGQPAQVEGTVSELQVVANWGIGGFAMGIVSGVARIGKRELPYYGLAELIE